MFCNICGKELNEEDLFCSRCGQKVTAEKPPFEEVVFNPPFKSEAKTVPTPVEIVHNAEPIREKPLSVERERARKKFATIDFTWDLNGYPTGEKPHEEDEVKFDWSTPVEEQRKKHKEAENDKKMAQVDQSPLDVVESSKEPENKEEKRIENTQAPSITMAEKPETDDLGFWLEEDEKMPKGNGITVEDFLADLQNHKSREERRAEEEKALEEKTAVETDISEGPAAHAASFEEIVKDTPKKSFFSFIKDALVEEADDEPEEELEVEPEAEEAVPEVDHETQPLEEEITNIKPEPVEFVCAVVQGPRTAMVMAPETVEVEEEKVEAAAPEAVVIPEINEFLPEGADEDGLGKDDVSEPTRQLDKFYTFNAKNEEFQNLLDQEYDKIKGDKPAEEIKAQVKKTNEEASKAAKEMAELKEIAKEKEAAKQSGEKKKPTWDEIFGDDDEFDEPKKPRNKARSAIITILIILLLVVGGAYGISHFAPESSAAKSIDSCVQKVMGIFQGGNKEDDSKSQLTQWIESQSDLNENIGSVEEDTDLTYNPEVDYKVKNLSSSYEFIDSTFYTTDDGEAVTYGQGIVGSVIAYYSELGPYMSGKKSDIKHYVEKDSSFYKEVSEKPMDPKGTIVSKLKIGDIRTSDKGFYVIAGVEIKADDSDQVESSNYVVYLTATSDKMFISKITQF